MRKDTETLEPGGQYATAHAAHYGTEDLREALELYLDLIAAHPDTQEAEYSRSQLQNIVKAVVPRQELLDAQVDCAFALFEHAGQPKVRLARDMPLASGLRTFTLDPVELPEKPLTDPSGPRRSRRVQRELKEEVRRMDTLKVQNSDIKPAATESQPKAPEQLPTDKDHSQSSQALRRTGSSRWLGFALLLFMFLLVDPVVATAQADAAEVPANSHRKSYGEGWECDWGYRDVNQSCVAVQVPANAHLDFSGHRWECSRGYREVDEGCAAVELPPKAFLDSGGHVWKCDRGYQQVDKSCVAIKVPANAHLGDSYGRAWECDRGYQEVNDACAVVVVPSNAHLDARGHDWKCDRGYQQVDKSCVAIKVPANAHLGDSFGRVWECDRGYQEVNDACAVVVVPSNAHLDARGHDWKCDRGYQSIDGSCVAVTVPPHGYLNASGDDWKCERGYRQIGGSCVAFAVPVNAHLSYTGNDWTCSPGYRPQGEGCIPKER